MTTRLLRISAAIVAALILAGCGGSGGGGDGTVADSDPGGIGGTGISSGSISAIGSIVVNGRRFDVEAAEISINGTPRSDSALEVGYVVDVRGDFDDGIAEDVDFVPDLIGPVGLKNIPEGSDTGSLTVMEQTVRVTPTTIFSNVADAEALPLNERVLVSGFRNSNQEIVASHIRLAPSSGEFAQDQVVGRAASVTPAGFKIGELGVGSLAEPDEGERVIVRGTYSSGENPPFDASQVVVADGLRGEPDDEVELEGIVEAFTDRSSPFTVQGVRVDGSGAAIEGGNLGIDAEVEVDGSFGENGMLIARRIEVDREENAEIEATVSSVSGDLTTVRLFGDELIVRVTGKTRLKDDTGQIESFGVDDIVVGDFLEIDGYVSDDGASVIATRLEREDPEDSTTIEGPVQNYDRTNDFVSLLGLEVNIQGAAFDDGSRDDIEAGIIVEISWEGTVIDPSVAATEVETEESDD